MAHENADEIIALNISPYAIFRLSKISINEKENRRLNYVTPLKRMLQPTNQLAL